MIGVSAVSVCVLGLLALPADPVIGDAKLSQSQRRLIVADPAKRRAVLEQLAEHAPHAAPAVPMLLSYARDDRDASVRRLAAVVVGAVGKELKGQTAAVLELTKSTDDPVAAAHLAFGVLKANDRERLVEAVKALSKLARHKELSVRLDLARTVSGFGYLARGLVPVLTEQLGDESPLVRVTAIQGLTDMGPAARAALPALRAALTDERNVALRANLETAIKQIDRPE